jgi:hypothetical protein
VCIRLYKIKNKDVRKDLNTYSENERRPPAWYWIFQSSILTVATNLKTEQIRKYTHGVTVLAHSPEFEPWHL